MPVAAMAEGMVEGNGMFIRQIAETNCFPLPHCRGIVAQKAIDQVRWHNIQQTYVKEI